MIDREAVLKAVLDSDRPVHAGRLAREFRIRGDERRELKAILAELAEEGKIARLHGKHYGRPSGRSGGIVGRLSVTSRGFGFVRPDWSGLPGSPPFEGDLFIPAHAMGSALDGDLVRAELLRRDGEGPSGRIESVLEHAHARIVGWYQQTNRRGGEVHPRNTRIDRRIRVGLPEESLGVSDYDWVEVEITEYSRPGEPLLGRVVERLGTDEDRGIDVLLLLRDRGIVEEFPASVEQEVAAMRFRWEEDLAGREDLRPMPTLTIDPKTAKDYDDGLSIEPLANGWRLYVHIADVSHFVRPGNALDTEAYERSTSVYPVDRVVPMLPSKLSNYLCSLVPHEDRLTMTAIMEIDRAGRVTAKRVVDSVIHSDYRFTYEEIQAFFDGDRKVLEPCPQLEDTIVALREVASVLRKARFDRGALDLDIPEVSILFDEDGAASDIVHYPRFESHQLVEECMLVANEAAAAYLTEKEAPLLYRVHEVADEARLERVEPALKAFGIRLRGRGGAITPEDLQRALDKAQEHPAGHILRRLILRAMNRAEYDPENVGHFGLASPCYCHFTSPIRRYPDVIVHRQLKALARREALPYPADDNELDAMGDHTSTRERRAQEAEWEAVAIKSLEFMKQFEGEEFDAYIASVQPFGLFVELERYPVEGFIRRAALRADHYDIDEDGIRMTGRQTGHVLKLADKIRVRIDRIDPMAQQMDVTPLDMPETKGRRGRGRFGERKDRGRR